jgi:hypothetical protein
MFTIRHDSERVETQVLHRGPLDMASAGLLVYAVLELAGDGPVVIDIAGASEVVDAALGRLVDGLPKLRACRIRGARRHHAQLVKYLGGTVEELPIGDSSDPPPARV